MIKQLHIRSLGDIANEAVDLFSKNQFETKPTPAL